MIAAANLVNNASQDHRGYHSPIGKRKADQTGVELALRHMQRPRLLPRSRRHLQPQAAEAVRRNQEDQGAGRSAAEAVKVAARQLRSGQLGVELRLDDQPHPGCVRCDQIWSPRHRRVDILAAGPQTARDRSGTQLCEQVTQHINASRSVAQMHESIGRHWLGL